MDTIDPNVRAGNAHEVQYLDREMPERAAVPDPRVEEALQQWAFRIMTDYGNGNKSDARTRLRQVPPERRYYVTMCLLDFAGDCADSKTAMRRLILSVTE